MITLGSPMQLGGRAHLLHLEVGAPTITLGSPTQLGGRTHLLHLEVGVPSIQPAQHRPTDLSVLN